MTKQNINLTKLHDQFLNAGFFDASDEELISATGGYNFYDGFRDVTMSILGPAINIAGIAFNTATGN